MIISHRGNVNGKNESLENYPDYIDEAIKCQFDVEIDVWKKNEFEIILGHYEPQYQVKISWLLERKDKLWIHCKNVEAIIYFNKINDFNYFWHQNDDVTLTSKSYIWAYPGKQPIENSIAVMPEVFNDDVSACLGICTDFPIRYKNENV
jgi:hypothetical protein